jgi:uncharacterized protein (DUF3820 family)
MARRHGRATMPWGKFKGVRIRMLPDDYLSWLTTSVMMTDQRWWWLKQSLFAEIKFRGLNVQGIELPDAQPEPVQKNFVRKFRVEATA